MFHILKAHIKAYVRFRCIWLFVYHIVEIREYSDVSEPPIPDGGAIPIPEMRTTHSENITTLKTGRSIIS